MKLDISRMRRKDDMEGGSWDGIMKKEENQKEVFRSNWKQNEMVDKKKKTEESEKTKRCGDEKRSSLEVNGTLPFF